MSGPGWSAPTERALTPGVETMRLARIGIPLAAVLLGLVRVWPGLAPGSLFLDDQWVAIALRDVGLWGRLRLDLPMPVGFSALAGLSTTLVGSSHLALQLVPAAAYLASLAIFPFLVLRLTGSAWAAALGAALLVAAPLTPDFAVRVKHYSLDQLVTVGVLVAMVPLLEAEAPRRFVLWTSVLAGAALLSFSSVFLSVAAVCTACVARWLRDPDRSRNVAITLVAGAFLAVVGVFFLLYVRRASRPVMIEYWAAYFPDSGTPAALGSFLVQRASTFFRLAVPEWAGYAALLAPVGLVGLWRSGHRSYCLALVAFYAVVLAAALARAYPMGAGRTDAYALAVTTLLVAIGASTLLSLVRASRLRHAAYGVVMSALVVGTLVSPGALYPVTADRAAVRWSLERLRPADGLVLSPYAVFALQLYGDVEGRVVPADYYGHGFDVAVERPRSITSALGRWDVATPEAAAGEVRRLTDFVTGSVERIVYLETHGVGPGRDDVIATIRAAGYEVVDSTGFGGIAEGYLFQRGGRR